LRPHPSDPRDFQPLRRALPMLQWSDSKQENVFAFLQKQDALIAADTSTHLEAILLNLASIYFQFSGNAAVKDYYGYVAHGLIDAAQDLPALKALLLQYQAHKPTDLFRRAAYYNATVGTEHEGQSQALAASSIMRWLR
jgi:hypothetical protein